MAQFTLGKDKKITGHTRIRELKKMIADRVGSTPTELRFLSGSQELTNSFDEKTLIDLDIGDLSQINLVMRLRGGKKITLSVQLYDQSNIKI